MQYIFRGVAVGIKMETFTQAKAFKDNPNYHDQKKKRLLHLVDDMLDGPMVGIVNGFNRLTYCFTLQSCFGHFIHSGKKDKHTMDPLPVKKPASGIEYRIAYIAFCIENSDKGEQFFKALKEIPLMAPEHIQFGSAEWFWKQQVNSYVLQVEPDRFKYQDTANLDYGEALNLEKIRNEFFLRLQALINREFQGSQI